MRLRPSLATALGTSTLVLGLCFASTLAGCAPGEPEETANQMTPNGDAGQTDANSQTSNNPIDNNVTGANSETNGYQGCEAYRWDEQAKREVSMRCLGNPNSWQCACEDGDALDYAPTMGTPDSTEATCEDALATHCMGLQAAPDVREALIPCGGVGDDVSVGQCWAAMDASGQVTDGSFDCRCAGEDALTSVSASSCGDALVSQCAAPCSVDGHQCEVDDYEIYSCTCDDASEATRVFGPTCEEAAANACDPGQTCGDDGDICRLSDEEGVWECACSSYYQGTREVYSPDDCEGALRRACEPANGPCSTWSGYCDQVTVGDFYFDCQCVDGTSQQVRPNQIGDTDDCSLAVVFACGEMDPPDDLACSDSGPNHRLECRAGEDEETGVSGYNCGCSEFSAENAISGGFFVEASTCAEVLEMTNCGG